MPPPVPLPLPLPLPISSLMTVDSTISHSLEICAGAARESHSSPCRRRRRFRTVPSVSAGRRLHFSGLEHERRTRSIRNEGHQFNVTDAFSGKERERWRCCDVDAKGANYIREVQEKESGGKHVSVHTGPGRSWHSTFPRRRQQYHYHR